MISISKEVLLARLSNEFGYPPHGAELIATDLTALAPALQVAFELWWTSGQISPLIIEGYNIETLMREHGMNPIAAILTLDWLVREPEPAKASLKRGHDRVTMTP